MDYRFCPRCNGLIEAGGESHCVCHDDDYGDYLYEKAKSEMLDDQLERFNSHELINQEGE